MTNFISTGATNYERNPAFTIGKKACVVSADFAITAASLTAGDTFELCQVNLSDRVRSIAGSISALTTADDNDLGFYTKDVDGDLVAIDADVLWDGADLTSALDSCSLLTNLNTSLDRTKTVGDLLSLGEDEDPARGILLVLTMNTASTADGTAHLDISLEDGTAK